jgi:LCP family protein required for cell wall assembly
LVLVLLAYFLAPFRTNILLLGLDSRPGEGDTSRSDTIILATFLPWQPYVGVLSIPRDLWVDIPGHGENRINTAHFFGEAERTGGGPGAAMQAVRDNFGVNVDYYVRVRFDGFRQVVDALGGVDVSLPNPMSGYPAGVHHLDGEQALALVRDRQGSDDFFRMERGQLFLKSVWKGVLKPANWPKIPRILAAVSQTVDTDIPVWLWPRLGFALLRLGPDGLDTRAITREMVTPFTTAGGAQVLGPRWEAINPVLMEVFQQ